MVQEKTYKWIQARLREIDSGALSEKDLARLREIANEDPFVADALEGFHAHPNTDHAEHLVAIEEKIKVLKRERRRWLVPNLTVTAIAACLMLLIGAYAVIIRMDNTAEEKTFVLVEPDSILSMEESSEAIAMEANPSAEDISEEASTHPVDDVTGQMSKSPVLSAPPKPDNKVTSSSRKEVQKKPGVSNDGIPVKAARAQAKEEVDRKQPEAFTSRHIKGLIVDATTSQVLAFSPYLLGHTNKLSFTDAKGQFEFDIHEKYVVFNLKHAGYEERTMTIPVTDENVVLELTPKNADVAESTPAIASDNPDKSAAAYFAFRDYISTYSFFPLGTGITSNGKKVTVEFTVGQDGRPQNVKVGDDTTGDKKYVIEALRLINTGPDWVCPGGQDSCERSYTFYFH